MPEVRARENERRARPGVALAGAARRTRPPGSSRPPGESSCGASQVARRWVRVTPVGLRHGQAHADAAPPAQADSAARATSSVMNRLTSEQVTNDRVRHGWRAPT